MELELKEKLVLEFTTNGAMQQVYSEFGHNFEPEMIGELRKSIKSTFQDLHKTISNLQLGKEEDDAVSHLTPEKINMMKEALDLKTFKMTIDDKKASFARGDLQMYPTIHLTSGANILKATGLQKASIVLEAIIFVLETCGISVPVDEKTTRKVIDFLTDKNDILQNINQIMENRDNYSALMTSIIVFVCNLAANGSLWVIVRLLYDNMSKFERALSVAKIAGAIGLMSATAGIVQIALLSAKLVKAAEFVKKLTNIWTLNGMQ